MFCSFGLARIDDVPFHSLAFSLSTRFALPALCSLARLTATTRTRPDVPLLTPGHSADLPTPPSSLLSSFLLPHALARMTSRSRSSNTASSALLPQEEALYSEVKHRWRDEDSSSSDGSDGSDASSDGDEEEKPRRRRRRAQPVQQGSSVRPLPLTSAFQELTFTRNRTRAW